MPAMAHVDAPEPASCDGKRKEAASSPTTMSRRRKRSWLSSKPLSLLRPICSSRIIASARGKRRRLRRRRSGTCGRKRRRLRRRRSGACWSSRSDRSRAGTQVSVSRVPHPRRAPRRPLHRHRGPAPCSGLSLFFFGGFVTLALAGKSPSRSGKHASPRSKAFKHSNFPHTSHLQDGAVQVCVSGAVAHLLLEG